MAVEKKELGANSFSKVYGEYGLNLVISLGGLDARVADIRAHMRHKSEVEVTEVSAFRKFLEDAGVDGPHQAFIVKTRYSDETGAWKDYHSLAGKWEQYGLDEVVPLQDFEGYVGEIQEEVKESGVSEISVVGFVLREFDVEPSVIVDCVQEQFGVRFPASLI